MVGRNKLLVSSVLLFGLVGAVFFGCRDRHEEVKLTPIAGDRYRGGVFRFTSANDFRSLFPPSAMEIVGVRLVWQIYEGLTSLNPRSLEVEPALARSWVVDSTRRIYTFFLRKGVRFHDSEIFPGGKGRVLTAQDVKFVFDFVCSAHPKNLAYVYVRDRIVGCDEFYAATLSLDERSRKDVSKWPSGGVSGVRVLNDSTVQIALKKPLSFFLELISIAPFTIWPRELLEHYGDDVDVHAVGTGPFMVERISRQQKVILKRNPYYWKKDMYGNELPYLDKVVMQIVPDYRTALLDFDKGEFELLDELPLDLVDQIVSPEFELLDKYAKYQLKRTPLMSLTYLGFLTTKDPFRDPRVRRAFCMAIDRDDLVQKLLKNTALPAIYGVVPPAFIDYDAKSVKGCPYDPEGAQRLLREAGYPGGQGFPEVTLHFNTAGGRNKAIAEVIKHMLEQNLNIRVKLEAHEWSEYLEKVESGAYLLFRMGWVADYADPESFLSLFYGKQITEKGPGNNYTRFQDSVFDALLDSAMYVEDRYERYILYQKLDQRVVDLAPVIPLYYQVALHLLQPYVRGFELNSMMLWDLSGVYLVPEEGEGGV